MKTGERRGNAGWWKTRKTKPRFPFVSHRPWKSPLRFPHSHRAGYGSSFFPKANPKKPQKGARSCACLTSSLQAHPWIRKCFAFNVWGLVVGILMVWLYAAMRPRLGAGPKTAQCAGFVIWVTVYALGSATPVFLHMIPVDLTAKALAAGLVETIVAGLAGACLYQEKSTAEGVKASAARV